MRDCSLSIRVRGLLAAAALVLLVPAASADPPVLYGGARSDDPYPTRFMSIDPATGMGVVIGTSVGPTYDGFQGLEYDPSTDTFYALLREGWPSYSYWLATIDRVTGLATQVGPLGPEVGWGPFGLAIDANGTLYTTLPHTDRSLRTIDKTTGAVSPSLGIIGTTVTGLAFDPAGTLYGVDLDHSALLTIDPANGAILSSKPASGLITLTRGLAWHEGMLWGAGGGAGSQLLTIDPATAAVTIIGPINQVHVQALAVYARRPVAVVPSTWGAVKTLFK